MTGMEIITSIDREIPKFIYNDEQRIKRIVKKLISNSIKYAKKGVIIIGITFTERYPDKFKFFVRDQG